MNRGLSLLLVILGAGALLVGFMDLLANDLTTGRAVGSFVIGPAFIVVGFIIDPRKPKPPKSPV